MVPRVGEGRGAGQNPQTFIQGADPGLAAYSGNAESQAPPRPVELESAFQLDSRAEVRVLETGGIGLCISVPS